jgi:beta-mannosidase
MPQRVADLDGDAWRLGQAPPDANPAHAVWGEIERAAEWLPAVVPGNVRADLVRAGHLPDVAYGRQAEASSWVDERNWWFIRDFFLPRGTGERIHLVFRGVDYLCDTFLNGQHLGRHEGMFSPQIYDVTDLLHDENRLAVRIVGSKWLPRDRSSLWQRLLNRLESRATGLSPRFPDRRDVLKCQMGFGWDFAPPLPTMGIWDSVSLVVTGDAFIRHVATRPWASAQGNSLTGSMEIDARRALRARLRWTLTGATFDSEILEAEQLVDLHAGCGRHTVELEVPRPRLWWPWDQGRPDLYRLAVEVWDGDRLLDRHVQLVGLREVAFEGWTLHVNDRPVYCRGANWVPADLFPGRVRGTDYRALLGLARQANMNTLRVWGGGLREKACFYDLCDRLGILVWQEFPFACAFLASFPRTVDYLRLVEAESRAIVRDLQNHPCVALWCGGNEFSPRRNAPLVATLGGVVQEEDPGRPFLAASPSDGDRHNWQVWHHFEPPSAYRRDGAFFASEFGLQASPDVGALSRFVPPDELWPAGPSWAFHGAGIEKLRRYAQPFADGGGPSLEAFVRASQRAQSHGLQIAIEHYRRRKGQGCGGALLWQLNEPWPGISWAIIDYFRRPKPAYEVVRRVFDPLLISVEYPLQRYQPGDPFCASLWIVNDRAESLADCWLEVVLEDGGGQPVHRFHRALEVAANAVENVGEVCWLLPIGGDWRLACRLTHGEQLLAENRYELAIQDDIQPTAKQRLRSWLAQLLAHVQA